MTKISRVFLLIPLLLLGACSGQDVENHPGQPVEKRKAAFKQMLQSMEQMGMVVRERQVYNAAAFLERARELKQQSQEPWQYFTPESNYEPTRAKPDIWAHPANFAEFRKELDESLNQLIAAAEIGKLEKVVPAYTSVEDSCQACHKRFRKNL